MIDWSSYARFRCQLLIFFFLTKIELNVSNCFVPCRWSRNNTAIASHESDREKPKKEEKEKIIIKERSKAWSRSSHRNLHILHPSLCCLILSLLLAFSNFIIYFYQWFILLLFFFLSLKSKRTWILFDADVGESICAWLWISIIIVYFTLLSVDAVLPWPVFEVVDPARWVSDLESAAGRLAEIATGKGRILIGICSIFWICKLVLYLGLFTFFFLSLL